MKDIISVHFPVETDDLYVLGGYADFTYGDAARYFTELDENDREIVQWYASQYVSPLWAGDVYCFGLARGYAIEDPLRKYAEGIDAALKEFKRVGRYVTLFSDSTDFFPRLRSFNSGIRDEDGKWLGSIDEVGWGAFAYPYYRNTYTTQVSNQLAFIEEAKKFVVDPEGSPFYFDQGRIIEEHKSEMEWRLLNPDIDPDS